MTTRIEINDILGRILFSYECEENTIKKTVEEAVKQNISLYGANLNGENLCNADLNGTDLSYADLHYADLRGADLCWANLYDADLRRAKLNGANLYVANLCWANLNGTDLDGINIREINLYGANLNGAKNIPFIPMICPSEGAFIGWKKVDDYLIKLFIPEDAKRSSATNKCRCDKAKVLEITNLSTNGHVDEIVNENYAKCVYKIDKMVYPDSFDDNRWNECSHGIHFFINKQEAIEYCI